MKCSWIFDPTIIANDIFMIISRPKQRLPGLPDIATLKYLHHTMRTVIFSILLLLTIPVSAQTVDNPDAYSEITRERYSFQYPKSWSVDTSKMFGMDVLLRSPKTDSLDDFIENMIVFVQDLHGQNYYLSKMGQESETQIKNIVTDVEIIESRLDSTASQQQYILTYKGRQGKFSLTMMQRYYLKNEMGYALTFTIKNGKEADYFPITEKMFNSFTLH